MLRSRPLRAIHMLALASAATFVLCAPALVVAQSAAPAPAPAAAKATTSASQHANHSAAEMNEHLQKMTQRLKLTDDQVVKVREIMQSKMSEMSELRAKYQGQPATPESKAAMEKAHKDLHADFEAKLAGVLNAEQMTEYKKMSAEHMKKDSAKKEKEEEAKEAKK